MLLCALMLTSVMAVSMPVFADTSYEKVSGVIDTFSISGKTDNGDGSWTQTGLTAGGNTDVKISFDKTESLSDYSNGYVGFKIKFANHSVEEPKYAGTYLYGTVIEGEITHPNVRIGAVPTNDFNTYSKDSDGYYFVTIPLSSFANIAAGKCYYDHDDLKSGNHTPKTRYAYGAMSSLLVQVRDYTDDNKSTTRYDTTIKDFGIYTEAASAPDVNDPSLLPTPDIAFSGLSGNGTLTSDGTYTWKVPANNKTNLVYNFTKNTDAYNYNDYIGFYAKCSRNTADLTFGVYTKNSEAMKDGVLHDKVDIGRKTNIIRKKVGESDWYFIRVPLSEFYDSDTANCKTNGCCANHDADDISNQKFEFEGKMSKVEIQVDDTVIPGADAIDVEIANLGIYSNTDATSVFEVTSFDIKVDSVVAGTYASGATLTFDAKAKNTTSSDETFVVVAATYGEDGKLIAATPLTLTAKAGSGSVKGTKTLTTTAAVKSVRAFCWKGLSDLTPLAADKKATQA